MSERIALTAPLTCWKGERGTYHLVTITGEEAEALQAHEAMQRLELGARRGFGSVKVMARIGETEWKTSVFPQNKPTSSSKAVGQKETPSSSEAVGQNNVAMMINNAEWLDISAGVVFSF